MPPTSNIFRVLTAAVVVMLLFPALVPAASAAELDQTAPRVKVGIFLLDLMSIDSARQTMLVDIGVSATWHDETLAGRFEQRTLMDLTEIWHPRIQIVGDLTLEPRLGEQVEVDPDGSVRHVIRYVGNMTTRMNLIDFPFDRHTLRMQVVGTGRQKMVLEIDETGCGQNEQLTVADWRVDPGSAHLEMFPIPGGELHSVVYNFKVTRHVGYYIWKIVVPLMLIVFMSWAVFWIDPVHFNPQIGAATASMLTLIAYRFALGNLVPKVSYFTRLDYFITGSTIMVFLALLEAITTSRLAKREDPTVANRMDLVSRIVFPAMFLILIVFAFLA